MSVSPVSFTKPGNEAVIDDGTTKENLSVVVTESWNKDNEEVRYSRYILLMKS